jgi:hypothetical protein
MWLALGGVKPLPVALMTWQLVQLVAEAWFIVAGVQVEPIEWQSAQVAFVIGATKWALAPLIGRPALGTAAPGVSWQPDCVQLVAEVKPLCVKLAGFQALVRWQLEHCDVVVMCVAAGVVVQVLPA